jgi:hypothetical protein
MWSQNLPEKKRRLRLSQIQKEILVGVLLGDACLESQNQGRTYRLKIEQSARHRDYVYHLYQVFQAWVLTPPQKRLHHASNGTLCVSWAFQTISHAAFRFYAHQFYREGKKRVPPLIHRWLTPRSLAYWFMDDGSMKNRESKGVLLNTQAFRLSDLRRLQRVLANHFGLQVSLRKQKEGMQLYLSGRSYERLVAWIGPFLHPSMAYKLPPARRTHLPKR